MGLPQRVETGQIRQSPNVGTTLKEALLRALEVKGIYTDQFQDNKNLTELSLPIPRNERASKMAEFIKSNPEIVLETVKKCEHLKRFHTNLSLDDLRERLIENEVISAATSFTTVEVAERASADVIINESQKIADWYYDSETMIGDRECFQLENKYIVGYGLKRHNPFPYYSLVIVSIILQKVEKSAANPLGIKVITAYVEFEKRTGYLDY